MSQFAVYPPPPNIRTAISALSPLGYSSSTGVLSIVLSDATHDGYLSSADWNTFNNKAPIDSPAFTGVPTAPTATVGTSTTQIATTAFVLSQGFLGATGSMPSAYAASTSVVTSASTTYVTAISTTITVTAASAPVWAKAAATLTVTGAIPTVAKIRVSINGVSGQEQLLSLTALTTNYVGTAQYRSAALTPGTYNVIFEIARNSGTGTVSFFEGSIAAIALQGSSSNGITQLTGDVTAGAGSGSQVATIPAGTITGAKIAANTITNSNILAGTITGASIAATTITNSNILTVDALKITTGTLPVARGGTGSTSFATQRIPFSNGTLLTTDALFIYDTTNQRFSVGGSGSATGNFLVTSGSKTALQAFNQSAGNAFQAVNVSAYTCALISRQNNATTGASIGFEFGRGTPAAPTQALSGDQIGVIVATPDASDGVAHGYCGAIGFVASENATTVATGGDVTVGTTPNGSILPIERVRITNDGVLKLTNGHLKSVQTTPPTAAPNPNAGTGATCTVSNATDIAGTINLTLGSAAFNAGPVLAVTFNKVYAVAPIVLISAANEQAAIDLGVKHIYCPPSSTTGFTVNFGVAPSTPGASYVWQYIVIETQ